MAEVRIDLAPQAPDYVRFREGFGTRFLVTVDTEEEFDWRAPLAREGHSIDSVRALGKFQRFCEEFGVAPAYLVDYPVATSAQAAEHLREANIAGRADIGVHLHPWLNPPHEEEVNEFNSFAGNLPAGLERAKFVRLRDAIEQNFGRAPRMYRAGRYGAGPNSAANLIAGGIAIDTSVRTYYDYSSTGGPNFRDHPIRPYWLDRGTGLIELPLTTMFWGVLRQMGPWLYPRMWRITRLRSVLAHLSLLERIPLTPEGITVEEAIRGIDMAIDAGLPVLVFSFHSPSLAPGYTPYVRDDDDLTAFYDWWRSIFTYLAQRNVAPASVAEIVASVELA